jgi:hypothetical protein
MSLLAWTVQKDRKIELLSCPKILLYAFNFLFCYFSFERKILFSFIAITIRSKALNRKRRLLSTRLSSHTELAIIIRRSEFLGSVFSAEVILAFCSDIPYFIVPEHSFFLFFVIASAYP